MKNIIYFISAVWLFLLVNKDGKAGFRQIMYKLFTNLNSLYEVKLKKIVFSSTWSKVI